ncbi:DnaD domain protein [Brockia lithotrophica]|uniref:Replicative DNA helicase loader DnaB n=1 Tax=Brockia lithotrophica TaxID=933949 RepID=A0A660KX85_9BACL|nr:DnaD domain protein [Brockia lithotrophica]RKQ84626.1 replicative DNA helicase loader DnaB [Brockia lithotrophica]
MGETRVAPTPFTVLRQRPLGEEDLRNLLALYVPFLGAEAFTLYLYWAHAAAEGEENVHAELFAHLRLAEEEFLRARRRLEGVGLLRTFLREPEGGLLYLLLPPLVPHEFLASDVLPALLRRAVGEERFRAMFRSYDVPPDPRNFGREVTASFGEAYPEYDLRNLIEALEAFGKRKRRRGKLGESGSAVSLPAEPISLHLVEDLAEGSAISGRSADEVRGKAGEPAAESGLTLVPRSKDEVLANFKTISPYDLLRHYQGVTELSPADRRLVDDLLYIYRLPSEVVNMLIDYVLLVKDKTFPRAFTEKVAATFARQGIRTAEEAYAFLRRYRRYHWKNRVPRAASVAGNAGSEGQGRADASDSGNRSRGTRGRSGRRQNPVRVPAYIRLEDVLGEDLSSPDSPGLEPSPGDA